MSEPSTPVSARALAEELNRSCRCINLDRNRLRAALEQSSPTAGLLASIEVNQPNLFSENVVFVCGEDLETMRATIESVERVIQHPAYRTRALAWAPEVAQPSFGPKGVLSSYDFHLGNSGPQLIEINTNAGGAFLNGALAKAQQACCSEVEAALTESSDPRTLDSRLVAMFRREWALQRGDTPLRTIAIIDDDPPSQYLYPEFLLCRSILENAGFQVHIEPPENLRHEDGTLYARDCRIDLVYNRLTDFHLQAPTSAALRSAYLAGDVVLTPHPHAYALYADKRNLTLLSSSVMLDEIGLPEEDKQRILASIPETRLLSDASPEEWWQRRKQLFFKPIDGFGGKAAYRGDKLTKSTFAEILTRPYIAQRLVPPSERTIEVGGVTAPLKLDLRNYVYDGRILLVAARLYQGQTTNFRTAGGGFAPVFTERAPSACAAP